MLINPELPLGVLSASFAAKRRIHVSDFLTLQDADRLEAALLRDTPFHLALNQGDRHFDLAEVQLAALSPDLAGKLTEAISAAAAQGFQYLYETHSVFDARANAIAQPESLEALMDFIGGRRFLDFARALTQDSRIAFADCQVTRYRPGHFLTTHNDDVAGKNRLYAFVLNLSRGWRADYGGWLAFCGADGHIDEAYVPAFNALNLFAVPAPHLVTMVAPFAPNPRLSVTGWLRAA